MYDTRTDWNETGDEKPETVITGNFGELYHYEVVGYLAEKKEYLASYGRIMPDTYSWFDVFVDGECINLGEVLANETDALTYFIQWVANEISEVTNGH